MAGWALQFSYQDFLLKKAVGVFFCGFSMPTEYIYLCVLWILEVVILFGCFFCLVGVFCLFVFLRFGFFYVCGVLFVCGIFEKTFLLAQLRSYNKDAKETYIVLINEANQNISFTYLNTSVLNGFLKNLYKAFLYCAAERRCQRKSTLASCRVQGIFTADWQLPGVWPCLLRSITVLRAEGKQGDAASGGGSSEIPGCPEVLH